MGFFTNPMIEIWWWNVGFDADVVDCTAMGWTKKWLIYRIQLSNFDNFDKLCSMIMGWWMDHACFEITIAVAKMILH